MWRVTIAGSDVAANGFEAVQAVDRTLYAAILMDCQMPEMDGYEAIRHIGARGTPDRVPIIALTADTTKEEETKTKEVGVDAFLTKPVRKAGARRHPRLFRVALAGPGAGA